MEIDKNKVVKMHYTGTLKDNKVFDSSKGREPLEFVYGLNMIIPGLEEGIKSLKVGDKKKVEIPFIKAYGPVLPTAKQIVPKSQLPKEAELKVGMQLSAQGPQGVIPVTISKILENDVEIDFNHPLAGKDLIFDVEIMDIRDATKEELGHGHIHQKEDLEKKEEEKDSGCKGQCKHKHEKGHKCPNCKNKD